MRPWRILGVMLLAASATGEALAQSPVPAPATVPAATMAHTCAACHGTLGRLGDEFFMPLAGMPVEQFEKTMKDFRDHKRPATLMRHVAEGFSDADIRAMGEFFAAVPRLGGRP